jgi:drug/metabolite transporter (DMT)-like permease
MKRAEVILLLTTVLWGSTFPVMKISIVHMPPLLFLAYRFGVASFLMLLLFRLRVLKRETFLEGVALGVTLFLGHGFQIIGLKYTTPSNYAFITSLYVVFTPFIAYFLLGDRLQKKDVMSLLIAMVGLYFISGAGNSGTNYGDMLTVLCAVSFAFQIVLVQKFGESDYISLAFWQIFWNFILSLITSMLIERPMFPTELTPWVGIIYTSVFATIIAFTLQVKYQKETTAYKAALIYSTEPIFGTIATFAILKTIPTGREVIGAGLIMTAIWLALRGENTSEPLSL